MKKYLWLLLPVILFAAITPFTPRLDVMISGFFYNADTGFFARNRFFDAIYHYGLYPAWVVSLTALVGIFASILIKSLRKYRKDMVFLVLALAVGSGLIANVIFKDHWGRPRPVQVVEFGGDHEFRPYYSPNLTFAVSPTKSFPSGHSTMGFYFFVLCFLGKRHKKHYLYLAGIVAVSIIGGMLGVTRIAQGGHFFSDVIAAAMIMWYGALIIDRLLYRGTKHERINQAST